MLVFAGCSSTNRKINRRNYLSNGTGFSYPIAIDIFILTNSVYQIELAVSDIKNKIGITMKEKDKSKYISRKSKRKPGRTNETMYKTLVLQCTMIRKH